MTRVLICDDHPVVRAGLRAQEAQDLLTAFFADRR